MLVHRPVMVVTGWLNTQQPSLIQRASFSTNLRPCTLPHFTLSPVVDRGQVVDGSVLQHRQEDEDEAHPQVNVHRLDVGHPGHGRVDSRNDGGHGQHRGDACTATNTPPPPLVRTEKTEKGEGPGKLTQMLAQVQAESNNSQRAGVPLDLESNLLKQLYIPRHAYPKSWLSSKVNERRET